MRYSPSSTRSSSASPTSAVRITRTLRTIIATAVLGPSLAVLMLAPSVEAKRSPPAAQTASAWVESWQSLAGWQPMTQACWTPNGSTVVGVCQSGGLRSLQTWDRTQPWSMAWQQRARAETPGAIGPQFWLGGGWWVCDDECGANYVTAVQEQNVGPIWGGPWIASLPPTGRTFGAYAPWTWLSWRLEWQPDRSQSQLYLNGRRVATFKSPDPVGPLRVVLVCASVPAGTPDDGSSARCEVGPLTITGVPL